MRTVVLRGNPACVLLLPPLLVVVVVGVVVVVVASVCNDVDCIHGLTNI